MPDIGGLQLLPETRKKLEIRVPGQNRSLILALVFAAVIAGLYFVLAGYHGSLLSSIATIDGQLADIEKSRDKGLETKLLNLNQQLSVVNPLLSKHLVWSDALIKIQNLILPQVQFVSFNTNADEKKYSFKAVAANYTTVARQISAFYSDDSFTDVILNKVAVQPSGRVDFTMQLTFESDKFLIKPAVTKP